MPGFWDAFLSAFDLSTLLGIIASASILILARALHHQMVGFVVGGLLAFFTLLSASIVFCGIYSFENFPQPQFALAVLFEIPQAINLFFRELLSGAILGVPISIAILLIAGVYFLNDLAKSIAADQIAEIEAEKLQLLKSVEQVKKDAERQIKEKEENAQSKLDEAKQYAQNAEEIEATNRRKNDEYRQFLALVRKENKEIEERVNQTNAKIDKMEAQIYSQAMRNRSAVLTLNKIIKTYEKTNPKFIETIKADLEHNRSIAKKKYDKLKVKKVQVDRQYKLKSN